MQNTSIPPVNLETLRDILVGNLGVEREQIQPESRFMEDLDADSLDEIELVMAFEEVFAIDISDEEAEKIKTVQQALDTLRALHVMPEI